MNCPECTCEIPDDSKFCKECGHQLSGTIKSSSPRTLAESERKYITILFSDLSGYTSMSERLDPEEIKEIMGLIFSAIAKIVKEYDGFIEKFIGDAVMAVFGIPKAHEDDAVRAIRAAMEIHGAVDRLSSRLETKTGCPLSMHSGINTGLAVTGGIDVEKGIHGLTGDAINIASRLQNMAEEGEIIVGPNTHSQAADYFDFEKLQPVEIRGKELPIRIFKLASLKKDVLKTHRLKGLQANLIGRDSEMAMLSAAADDLKNGIGSVIAIIGDAGTGKSRLKYESKKISRSEDIHWLEGHAYSYTQNMPYYPLIDLLTRAFDIDESDAPETIRLKLDAGISILLGENSKCLPVIGSLFQLSYPEADSISPVKWKYKLFESIETILSEMVKNKPTIVCFEDLHWADPSFIELFERLVVDSRQKALVICTYRSHFTLFGDNDSSKLKIPYKKIHLLDLAKTEAQEMLRSLLASENIPDELQEVVERKADGNPFYIEEIINSLIESEVLIRENDHWILSRKITDNDIPSTIHGVLTARVDRLGGNPKRILQEASVIGRAFLYKVLDKISSIESNIYQYLGELEALDLIRRQANELEPEYIFKHALTQEVVYGSLLKRERQEIHERIGLAIESLFHDRLPEFTETLAYHFSEGKSPDKAFYFLVESGKKSIAHYSLSEAHTYFQKAYEIISSNSTTFVDEKEKLSSLLIKWAYVFNQMGDFNGLTDLLITHEESATNLENKVLSGLFYAWIGWAYERRLILKKSHHYLTKAFELGQKYRNEKITIAASTYLIWTCADMGMLDDALGYADGVMDRIQDYELDPQMYQLFWCGIAYASWFKGESDKCIEAGNILLESGTKHSDNRKSTLGYMAIGFGFNVKGDLQKAMALFQKAAEIALDPQYYCDARFMMGFCYIAEGKIDDAKGIMEELLRFNKQYGFEFLGESARTFEGMICLAKGDYKKGLDILKNAEDRYTENDARVRIAWQNHLLGKFYLKFVGGEGSMPLRTIISNLVFLMKTMPTAGRKAERHLKKAIEISKEIGAGMVLGPALLDLGYLHKLKKNPDKAERYFKQSIKIFKKLNNDTYLKKAEALLKATV